MFDWTTYQPNVITHLSKHYSSRHGFLPRAIILHHTAGSNSLNYLTENALQVSTHCLIQEATNHPSGAVIYDMVPDNLAAHTVGFSNMGIFEAHSKTSPNVATLNLEIENLGNGKDPYLDGQYVAAAWKIRQWWNKFGKLYVFGHSVIDTQGKTDPAYFDYGKLMALVTGNA